MTDTALKMNFDQFAEKYCETQESTPEFLREALTKQRDRFQPDGWFMLECAMLDSSRLGERTILPFGTNNTFKTVPDRPVSPRGLASDMAVVIAVLPVSELAG